MKDFLFHLKILAAFWEIISKKDFLLGRTVKDFEERLSNFLGVKYVIGVGNCTDALVMVLKAFNVGPGDEVIVPAVSFFATAAAVSWVNAKPIFVDVDLKSLNINPNLLEKAITPRTKAVIVVHLNGRMADMEPIMRIARRKKLVVIEDAAHAIGAKYNGNGIGYYGDAACLSFNIQKILNTYGDGGAVVTNNPLVAEKIALMRTYGARFKEMDKHHSIIGIASRIQSFQAAVLAEKLKDLPSAIEQWRRNYFTYSKLLAGFKELEIPEIPEEHFINGYRYVVFSKKRDELYRFLKDRGIDAGIRYNVPLAYLEAFSVLGYKTGDFPSAEKIAKESLVLPTNGRLSENEIIKISGLIKTFLT